MVETAWLPLRLDVPVDHFLLVHEGQRCEDIERHLGHFELADATGFTSNCSDVSLLIQLWRELHLYVPIGASLDPLSERASLEQLEHHPEQPAVIGRVVLVHPADPVVSHPLH